MPGPWKLGIPVVHVPQAAKSASNLVRAAHDSDEAEGLPEEWLPISPQSSSISAVPPVQAPSIPAERSWKSRCHPAEPRQSAIQTASSGPSSAAEMSSSGSNSERTSGDFTPTTPAKEESAEICIDSHEERLPVMPNASAATDIGQGLQILLGGAVSTTPQNAEAVDLDMELDKLDPTEAARASLDGPSARLQPTASSTDSGCMREGPATFEGEVSPSKATVAAEVPLPEARGMDVRWCSGPSRERFPPNCSTQHPLLPRVQTSFPSTLRCDEETHIKASHWRQATYNPDLLPQLSQGRCISRAAPEEPLRADVALSVYALKGAAAVNKIVEMAGLSGAYHVGVEIFSLEWSFGCCHFGTGVHNVYSGCSPEGTFKERIVLGQTPCTPQEVIAIIGALREAWTGSSYHVLRRNCVHFCMELVRRLQVHEFPQEVNALASFLSWLTEWGDAPDGQAVADAPPAVDTSSTSSNIYDQTASELDWKDAQRYMLDRAADAVKARRMRILAEASS